MSPTNLTRRKTQIELLAALCQQRVRVRIARARQGHEPVTVHTRFLALEPESVLLEWPLGDTADIAISGDHADVFFEHQRQRYAFRTQTRGRVWHQCPRRGQVAAWRLAMPLRIERKQQRAHYRVSLADLDPITVCVTNVPDPEWVFEARLANVSPGGLGLVAWADDNVGEPLSEMFWAKFELPGQPPLEFVVRVVHANTIGENEKVVIGCMFCPGDDPALYRDQVCCIEQFAAKRERAQLRRISAQRGRGT